MSKLSGFISSSSIWLSLVVFGTKWLLTGLGLPIISGRFGLIFPCVGFCSDLFLMMILSCTSKKITISKHITITISIIICLKNGFKLFVEIICDCFFKHFKMMLQYIIEVGIKRYLIFTNDLHNSG